MSPLASFRPGRYFNNDSTVTCVSASQSPYYPAQDNQSYYYSDSECA